MEQRRGILFLADPLCAAALPQKHTENPEERLIFSENEPLRTLIKAGRTFLKIIFGDMCGKNGILQREAAQNAYLRSGKRPEIRENFSFPKASSLSLTNPQVCQRFEERLIFSENEPLLPQAQEALWRVRRRCGWVCVAASGGAVGVALALAAQLPVDRVALAGGRLLAPDAVPRPRSLARIDRYARRNLALVASEVLILDADAEEIAGFARLFARRQLCALETGAPRESPWQRCAPLLCAPWEAVNEKNLLIPGKCV